ncbi:MAG TPA: hypothetical protein DIT30_03535 [Verrucomicrobiales bacterium]|jgi:ornithine racemase|nr:hypothetical protein [Verrucomicrobiales bacterium]
MTRMEINIDALQNNFQVIDKAVRASQSEWCVVAKLLCGFRDGLEALAACGARTFADSRLRHLESIREIVPDAETWYLRPPPLSQVRRVVATCNASLNTEEAVLVALNQEAARQGVRHKVILMAELGERREGASPEELAGLATVLTRCPHLDWVGLGANLGCLHGILPTTEHYAQLKVLREWLEMKFSHSLPLISAGTSLMVPGLIEQNPPPEINHYRIGEILFLGRDLETGKPVARLRQDVFRLFAEIVELREKGWSPLGDAMSGISPFAGENKPEGQEGKRGWRALLAVGRLDGELSGLVPEDPQVQLAGASSDLLAVNLIGDKIRYKVGDCLSFRPDYSSALGLMHSHYIEKTVLAAEPMTAGGTWRRWLSRQAERLRVRRIFR